MKIHLKILCLLVFALILSTNSKAAVIFDWAVIGDTDNLADTQTGYGAVDYEYRIATTEVTNAQYVEFLNAVASTDTYGLYNNASPITRYGESGSYTYTLKDNDINWANRPVAYVSWYDTLRFVNWLHNGQPTGFQNAGTTEYGAYDMSLQQTNPEGIVRLSGAQYCLPTEDEWYKAAYYDSVNAVYYDYATGSDTTPNNNDPQNDTGNSANHDSNGDFMPYNTTPVGAYDESTSPYGTYDQNGNVLEWNETLIDGNRGLRGGSWFGYSGLSVTFRGGIDPNTEFLSYGFRVIETYDQNTAIPEPASIGLIMLSLCSLALRRMKKS